MATSFDNPLVRDAAVLRRLVNDHRFTPSFALLSVSNGDQEFYSDANNIEAVEVLNRMLEQQSGPIELIGDSVEKLKERCSDIWKLVKKTPRLSKTLSLSALKFDHFRDRKLTDIMRLLGCEEKDVVAAGALYNKIMRYIKRLDANPSRELAASSAAPATTSYPPPFVDIQDRVTPPDSLRPSASPSNHSAISLLSNPSQTAASVTSIAVSASEAYSTSASLLSTAPSNVVSRPGGRACSRSDFVKLTTLPERRRNIQQTQDGRKEDMAWKDVHRAAHKAASILYAAAQDGRLHMKHLKTAEEIAQAMNDMVGCETLSGAQLRSALREGRPGVSPPRQGPPTRVDTESFLLICQLVFTCQSIEQANCDPNRLNRQEMISQVGAIVNKKLADDRKDPLNDVKFYERVAFELARDCELTTVDKRELLRAMWLTYENQHKHYTAWESCLVELGFARRSENDEERLEHGHVVFFQGQRERIIQFDEMSFNMDGSKNGKGGRPAATTTNSQVTEAGKPENKSSQKATWMFGTTFADEPIPPMCVIQSTAKEPRYRRAFLMKMAQVQGKFGYDEPRFFSGSTAASENGSVTNEIFVEWLQNTIVQLFPDCADIPGKRLLLKADSGPGRFYDEFRALARSFGIYFFPGLPNGTELGQEMDQLFGFLKSIMEENRACLFRKRYDIHGEKARVDVWDQPVVLYGGDVLCEDGTSITLRNAFEEGLAVDRLRSAREKCGYCPATRAGLKSEKLRHEVFENEHGVDSDRDPLGILYDELEQQNHHAVEKLVNLGFTLATNLKRSINRVSESRFEARRATATTLPNTRERQDVLKGISNAGLLFKATNGGIPMNNDDCIIGMELKNLDRVSSTLVKTKKARQTRAKQIADGEAVFQKRNGSWLNLNKWSIADLKVAIKWKKPEQSINMGKDALVNTLRRLKDAVPPEEEEWTEYHERQLMKAQSGNIESIERTGIMRRARAQKVDFLSKMLKSLPQREMLTTIGAALEILSTNERSDFLLRHQDYANGHCYSDEDSSISTLDVGFLLDAEHQDDADSMGLEEFDNESAEDPGRLGGGSD